MLREKNCLGYAHQRLGLTSEEGFINALRVEEWSENFEVVLSLTEAEAVGFIGPFYCKPALVHMAVIDNGHPDMVWQRPERGGKEEHIPLREVREEHREKGEVLLRVKPGARACRLETGCLL
jgi:hypothetical protein